MKKRNLLIKIFVILAVLGLIYVAIYIYAESLQKQTCKFIIEHSLAVFVNRNEVRLETQLDGNWKTLTDIERTQLLSKVKEREKEYTECSDYPYLLNAQNASGNELSLFARIGQYGLLEMRLGE